MGKEIDILRVKSLLSKIVMDISSDSWLYGLALLIEAYKTIENRDSKRSRAVLKKIVEKATSDCERCNYPDIIDYLSSQGSLGEKLLKKLQELHDRKESSPPHMRVLFIVLFAEAVTSIAEEYATRAIPEGIFLGERLLRIISIAENDGTDRALNYLNNSEMLIAPLDSLPSLLEITFNKYAEEGLESRFRNLHAEFSSYAGKHEVFEKLREMVPNSRVAMLPARRCLGYIFARAPPEKLDEQISLSLAQLKKPTHYTLGRYIPGEHIIICNLWTIFFGPLWKIVLLHERLEAFSSFYGICRSFTRISKKVSTIEEHGLNELCHSLKHWLTIIEAKRISGWESFVNVALGMIPYGQIIGLAWFHSLEKVYPEITLRIPTLSASSETISGAQNHLKQLLDRTLEIIIQSGRGTTFSELIVPDPVLFIWGGRLRREVISDRFNARIRRAKISRSIIRLLVSVPSTIDRQSIVREIQTGRDPYKPRDGCTEEEICQVLDMLSSLFIIKGDAKKHALCLANEKYSKI